MSLLDQVVDIMDKLQLRPCVHRPDGRRSNRNRLLHHRSHAGTLLRHCQTSQRLQQNQEVSPLLHSILRRLLQHSKGNLVINICPTRSQHKLVSFADIFHISIFCMQTAVAAKNAICKNAILPRMQFAYILMLLASS